MLFRSLEHAVAGVALQVGGAKSLFSSVNSLQYYVIDAELLGNPIPVLTKPNSHPNPRTEPLWPHTNETLSMPVGTITFSNDDLCCPEPNHNRPLFVSVEHRNKLIRRALLDQGSCVNILPVENLHELGYGREHLVPDTLSVTLTFDPGINFLNFTP